MTEEKRVFEHVVEALFVRGLQDSLTANCRDRLAGAGLRLGERLQPAYSLLQWTRFLQIAAEELYAGLPRASAYRRLGECVVDGLRRTWRGRAFLLLQRLAGPRQHALRLPQALRRAGTFMGEVAVVEKGPGHVELFLEELGAEDPGFLVGLLGEALREAGGREVRVEPLTQGTGGCRFRLCWREK